MKYTFFIISDKKNRILIGYDIERYHACWSGAGGSNPPPLTLLLTH